MPRCTLLPLPEHQVSFRVDGAERVRIVPDEFSGLAKIASDGIPSIVVTITARKHDDTEAHGRNLQCNRSARSVDRFRGRNL